MRVLKWLLGILAVLLLAIVAVVLVFGFFGAREMPVMARGFRGPLIFGPLGMFGGWAFLLGRLLLPLVFLALLFLVGLAIGTAIGRARTPVVPAARMATCPNCGRPVQADWNHCPNCGASLHAEEPHPIEGGDAVQ